MLKRLYSAISKRQQTFFLPKYSLTINNQNPINAAHSQHSKTESKTHENAERKVKHRTPSKKAQSDADKLMANDKSKSETSTKDFQNSRDEHGRFVNDSQESDKKGFESESTNSKNPKDAKTATVEEVKKNSDRSDLKQNESSQSSETQHKAEKVDAKATIHEPDLEKLNKDAKEKSEKINHDYMDSGEETGPQPHKTRVS